MTTTQQQQQAIEHQAKVYDSDDCPGCSHLVNYEVKTAGDSAIFADGIYNGQVEVWFTYAYPDGDDRTGLEVTIFDAAGDVVSSQDFG